MFSGGYDDGRARAEILEFDGTGWQEVGKMDEPRYGAAAQAYNLDSFKLLDLKDCV